MKPRTRWIITLILVLCFVVGFIFFRSRTAQTSSTTEQENSLQTAVARRGDLVVYASGTGSLVPATEISLGFEESGTLVEVLVSVGDKVNRGDVLARLQTNQSPEEIAVSISETELQLIQAQQAIKDLYANADMAKTNALSEIATYAQAVRDAQYQLENFTLPVYLQGMDVIEAVDVMKARLDAAWEAFEPYRYLSPENPTRQALLAALNEAQSQFDAAVKWLNYTYQLQVAEANLTRARQTYEKYKDGPAEDELKMALAEIANAEARLALAKEAQAILELKAPIAGTVTAVEAVHGEALAAAPFITLADLDTPMLEVYVDETDLDKVAIGNAAEVEFDAFPGLVLNGRVISITPVLETVGNVNALKILVALDKTEINPTMILPKGLNASVDIIAGKAENAILVPVEALREIDTGEYAVFVIENGTPHLRLVEVGLMDVTFAEILSGLEEGEVVSTGIVQTE